MKKFLTLCALMISGALMAVAEKAHAVVFGYMGKTGLILGLDRVPTAEDFNKYRVTDPNSSEVIRQRLYDWQLYPTAGVNQFTFFAQPQGAGITSTPGAVAGSPKSLSDTNMQLQGQLSSGIEYLIESIEVYFLPGSVSTANTYTPAKVTTDATAVLLAANVSALNDVALIYNTGLLRFKVLNKDQLVETPLRSFPPKTWMELDAAVATTASTVSLLMSANRPMGRPYYIEPEVSLQPATTFGVTIEYPAAQATPSGFNGRIGVVFDGYMRRASQ